MTENGECVMQWNPVFDHVCKVFYLFEIISGCEQRRAVAATSTNPPFQSNGNKPSFDFGWICAPAENASKLFTTGIFLPVYSQLMSNLRRGRNIQLTPWWSHFQHIFRALAAFARLSDANGDAFYVKVSCVCQIFRPAFSFRDITMTV